MNEYFSQIQYFIKQRRGVDFSTYDTVEIENHIKHRLTKTQCSNCNQYLHYLQKHNDELDHLVDALTVNVSGFFRNPMTFEYIAGIIIPDIVLKKKESGDHSLRIWSTGCSTGEETYSVAIILNEMIQKDKLGLNLNIFGTDIGKSVLKNAKKAIYPFESIKNVKYGILNKYFIKTDDSFMVVPEIKNLVTFAYFDMLDKKSYAPTESVFGNFDLVLCRNLLIYFHQNYQNEILRKLYRALSQNGYLVLGKTEIPTPDYRSCFKRVSECCHVYRKN